MRTNCVDACAHLTITVSEIQRDICEKIGILSYPLHSTPPLGGFPSEHRHPLWDEKTRMLSLPDGKKNSGDVKCCMDRNKIRCLQIVLQHVPIYLQQFPSYSNRKCRKSPFSRTAAHIFVSPGDAPGAITLNVVWMVRKFHANKLCHSKYPSIFNSFPVIRTASAKNRHFHVPQPTFLFPLETPMGQSR